MQCARSTDPIQYSELHIFTLSLLGAALRTAEWESVQMVVCRGVLNTFQLSKTLSTPVLRFQYDVWKLGRHLDVIREVLEEFKPPRVQDHVGQIAPRP